MARLIHGEILQPDEQEGPVAAGGGAAAAVAAAVAPVDLHNFDLLFPDLQTDPANLLDESSTTVARLVDLGKVMLDPALPKEADPANNSPIPAVYTYFGQFIDHDITLEKTTEDVDLFAPGLAPKPLDEIRDVVRNTRSATLDLDSVYDAPAPTDPADPNRMRIGTVTPLLGQAPPFLPVPGKGADNDLPRKPRNADKRIDREALIGDPRNDENTIVSQLHVAVLKAHNALVAEGRGFEEARRILRQHYQHVVVHDYLNRICDKTVVARVVEQGNRWFDPFAQPFFMPLEFSVAGFRLGHTMVRAGYDFNLNFNLSGAPAIPASLDLLFTFTALSGQLGDNDTLPDNWIVEWEHLAGDTPSTGGMARRFDTRLAGPSTALFRLTDSLGKPLLDLNAMLAVRNLLRGYLLRMPTGQAMAAALGEQALTPAEITAAAGPDQKAALTAGGFDTRTPLWFYVLAEAKAKGDGGAHLGPVGSTIVAEVLVGLARRSTDSIMRIPGWLPGLPSQHADRFELADLLRYAGVLPGGAPARVYTVQAGDSLFGIARDELKSGARWPEIFARNRAVLARPDRIFPGQKLYLPTGPAPVPQLSFHVVAAGETLSEIAREHLGDAARWPEIFALNGAVLTNPDVIVVGQVLQLPPK